MRQPQHKNNAGTAKRAKCGADVLQYSDTELRDHGEFTLKIVAALQLPNSGVPSTYIFSGCVMEHPDLAFTADSVCFELCWSLAS